MTTYANGVTETRGYDANRQWLLSITSSGSGGTIFTESYTRNDKGLITTVTSNRADGNWTYAYDANGNLTSGGGRTIVYDGKERPVTVTALGQTTDFVYGPEGKRLKKTSAGQTTLYLGADEEITPAGERIKHPYSDVRKVGTTINWMQRDHLSSVRLMTDATGAVISENHYRPYGERTNLQVSLTVPRESKGWIGERDDPETGLTYLNARYYDPILARFVSPDWFEPQSPGVGTNRYAYGLNNPIAHKDPSGNVAFDGDVPDENLSAPGHGLGGVYGEEGDEGANYGQFAIDAHENNKDGWFNGYLDGLKSFQERRGKYIGKDDAWFSASAHYINAITNTAVRDYLVARGEVSPLAAAATAIALGAAVRGVRGPGFIGPPNRGPDFVVTPNGTAFPVPKGAYGPNAVVNPAGKHRGSSFIGGTGGANKAVDTMRIWILHRQEVTLLPIQMAISHIKISRIRLRIKGCRD